MNQLTESQVASMAPDASALKAGRELANARKWLNMHHNERVLWGEVQGSGREPYRTQIDLGAVAFKCSCPSRKFPCKHGLGLMFIFSTQPEAVGRSTKEPDWVSSWMERRAANADRPTPPPAPERPVADDKKSKEKAKRADERVAAVQAGAAELELLLRDLLRTGLANVPDKGEAYYEKVVRRMVDAKAGGLANWVRNFNKINYLNGNAWHSEVLENAVKAWMLIGAFRRMDTLEAPVNAQIRSLVGWSQSKKELLENPDAECITEDWLVLGKQLEALDDKLNVLRTWLFGSTSGRSAVLIDYSPAHQAITSPVVPGTRVRATLAFFPSNYPYRAQIKEQGAVSTQVQLQVEPLPDWLAAQQEMAQLLALSPWADAFPQYLAGLSLVTDQRAWLLKDRNGAVCEIDASVDISNIWQLLAVSGGGALSFFVLRTGHKIVPLGYLENQTYHAL